MTAVVFASSKIPFRACLVGCRLLREVLLSCWMFVCLVRRVPVCAGVVSSGSSERCQSRGREHRGRGQQRQRTTPSERRADRGSDSTFQMADIARRILVRGSASPPVCETADCFLVLSLSLLLSIFFLLPLPPACLSLSPKSKQKTQLSTLR